MFADSQSQKCIWTETGFLYFSSLILFLGLCFIAAQRDKGKLNTFSLLSGFSIWNKEKFVLIVCCPTLDQWLEVKLFLLGLSDSLVREVEIFWGNTILVIEFQGRAWRRLWAPVSDFQPSVPFLNHRVRLSTLSPGSLNLFFLTSKLLTTDTDPRSSELHLLSVLEIGLSRYYTFTSDKVPIYMDTSQYQYQHATDDT